MSVVLSLSALFLLSATASEARRPWTPQCGTPSCPKTIRLSPTARYGDVFEISGQLYRAKSDVVIHHHHTLQAASPTDNSIDVAIDSTLWNALDRTTLAGARTLAPNMRLRADDVTYDADNRKYYRAVFDHVVGRVSRDMALQELANVTSHWMTSLRPLIGDRRLSDIVLPGSHDSGTDGMGQNSTLVDRSFLYSIGNLVIPRVFVNWSHAQNGSLAAQLEAGFRTLDLRIADLGRIDGSFRWWHGITANRIDEGLGQIADFARACPQEVIVLGFQNFAAPGDALEPTKPIPDARKDELAALLLQHLGSHLANSSRLPRNPTINEVLATGASIIAVMEDDYIRAKDDRFWPTVIVSEWESVSNPENLFNKRSKTLKDFRQFHADEITAISGCVTPNAHTVVAALVRVYGDDSTRIQDALRVLAPEIFFINPDEMSFEGLFVDLLSVARRGTNSAGMRARPANLYSSGASVHYGSTPSDQARFWIARPQMFKLNSIYVDDFVSAGELVDVAIRANRGDIGRQVSVAFQGNPMDGYYTWEGFRATGGRESLNCSANLARYRVTSTQFIIDEAWKDLAPKTVVSFQEGIHPPDAELQIQVSGTGISMWFGIYSGNIEQMIENTEDLYLRGTDLGHGHGFAYTSYSYNLFSSRCYLPPAGGYLAMTQWT